MKRSLFQFLRSFNLLTITSKGRYCSGMRCLFTLALVVSTVAIQAQDFRIPYADGAPKTVLGREVLDAVRRSQDWKDLERLGQSVATRKQFLRMLNDSSYTRLEFYAFDNNNKATFIGNELSYQSGKYKASYSTTRLREVNVEVDYTEKGVTKKRSFQVYIGIGLKATGDIRVRKATVNFLNLFSFALNSSVTEAIGELEVDGKGVTGDGIKGLSFPNKFTMDAEALTSLLTGFARFDERLSNLEEEFSFRPQILYTEFDLASEVNTLFDKQKFLKGNRK